jgi:hypothetical protein
VSFARDLSMKTERLGGAGFAMGLRWAGRDANFMSYDCMKTVCCQDKYIVGELLVRTDWEVVGGARVMQIGERRTRWGDACR